MINVENLSKSLGGREILRGVSFRVEKGENLILAGRNGAGKTTLIRCILGEYRPDSGLVEIDGVSPFTAGRKALEKIGFVPQTPPPLRFSVKEVLEYAAAFSGFKAEDAVSLCRAMGLEVKPHANKSFKRLSGGMKQKLLISAALAGSAEYVFFDEPTANLDAGGRKAFSEILSSLAKVKTFVFVSHRTEEFENLSVRAIEMDMGEVVKNEIVGAGS